MKNTEKLVRDDLAAELASAKRELEGIERDREIDLLAVAGSREMQEYLTAARARAEARKTDPGQSSLPSTLDQVTRDGPSPGTGEALTAALGASRKYFVSLVVFGPDRSPMFVDELNSSKAHDSIVCRRASGS